MERRVAVHLVLIVVFGQIHSATFKIERYSTNDSQGVLVSFGKATGKFEALEFDLDNSGYFCLKHTDRAYLNFYFSKTNELQEVLFFRIDDASYKRYGKKEAYEHDQDIDTKKKVCFFFGFWRLSKDSVVQYEVFITFLSEVQRIESSQVAYFSFSLNKNNFESYLYTDEVPASDKISKEIKKVKESEEYNSKLENLHNYDGEQQLLIGFLKGHFEGGTRVNLSIDNENYRREKDGNFYMVIYNDQVTNKDVKDALDNFVKSSSSEKVENRFASITFNQSNLYIETNYQSPSLDETPKNEKEVGDKKGGANNAKGSKQHI